MTPNSENKRVWFITGASKGLGYAFTCAALKAGDKVVAVARTIDNLAKLKETYPETLLPLRICLHKKLSLLLFSWSRELAIIAVVLVAW